MSKQNPDQTPEVEETVELNEHGGRVHQVEGVVGVGSGVTYHIEDIEVVRPEEET